MPNETERGGDWFSWEENERTNALNRPHQIPLEVNLSYVRICRAPGAGRWSPPPKVGCIQSSPPPCLRSYVEFVPGSTCEPAGHDGSSVLAGKPYEPDSGRKRRRRKPQKWDRPNGHQRPTKDERCTWQICDGRNGAPYLLAFRVAAAVQKFYARSWPT